jgi:hypothetical protein
MDRMLDLMGEHEPDFLFVQLFLRQLPSQVRAALVNATITDCRRLAEEADTFFPVGQGRACARHRRPPRGENALGAPSGGALN